MKNINRRILLASMLATASSGKIFADVENTSITVGVYSDYLPLSANKDGKWEGFAYDFGERLIKQPEQKLKLTPLADLNWKRSLRLVETGELHLLYEVSYTKERAKFMDYIGVTDIERSYLIVREEEKVDEIKTFDDFTKFEQKILVNSDVVWSDEFTRLLKEDASFASHFDVKDGTFSTSEENELQMARMISTGRIGGYLFTEMDYKTALNLGNTQIDNGEKGSRLKVLKILAFNEPKTYVVVPQIMDQSLRDLIRQNYNESRQDGSFDAIWTKWQGDRTSPPNVSPY